MGSSEALYSRETVDEKFSEGARLVWVAMRDRGLTQAAVARELGTVSAMVSKWLYGVAKPGRRWADKIKETYGVEPSAWDEKPKKKFTPPGAKRAA